MKKIKKSIFILSVILLPAVSFGQHKFPVSDTAKFEIDSQTVKMWVVFKPHSNVKITMLENGDYIAEVWRDGVLVSKEYIGNEEYLKKIEVKLK
jgi:hypothetical protein